ncbi:glycosyltransferase family 87 protein [Chamaesiphon sp. GL140_3_metabinner_50]|uniref:glycosyltransferase family 87 protein n=1 Tax=Chamaesiphon sp. GL140_3_metabinner_50 TaxID=2970812 RepID=UPI0025E78FCB|nr:glycosyltransferase family 87 protein [Chamaesiphon sp. GL140_3_metabinner_50]
MVNNYIFFTFIIISTLSINALAKKILKREWVLWLCSTAPFIIMTRFMWKVTVGNGDDFIKAYYPAGKQVLQNPFSMYHREGADVCVSGFVNIPLLAYVFTPLNVLSETDAARLFRIIGILAIFITWYLLIKITQTFDWRAVVLTGLFIINGPLYYSVKIGNSTHFVLLLLVVAYYFNSRKMAIWNGVLVAITAFIKVPLWLLGFYYLARKKWWVVAGYGAALIAIVGASLLLFGTKLHLAWYQECIAPFADKPIGAFNVQSVNSFLARLLLNAQLNSWQLLEISWDFKVARAFLLFLLVGVVIFVFWRSKSPNNVKEKNLEFSIVLCLALVISPIAWTHYYLLLLLPYSLYIADKLAVPQGWRWATSIWLSAFLISLPVIFESQDAVVQFLFFKVLISHYFFGGIILLGVLLAARLQNNNHPQPSNSKLEV